MDLEQLRKEEQKLKELHSSVQVLLSSPHGKRFIAHLFDSFMVGESIPMGLDDRTLVDYSSYMRAGNSIYKLCIAASAELTGKLISEMHREKQKDEEPFTNESNTGNRE